MEPTLATLLYVGVLVPTIITVVVFIGFLICLYKRSRLRKDTLPLTTSIAATPRTPSFNGSYRSRKSATHDKFESSSQHSVDSAIDLADMEMATDTLGKASAGIILSTLKLGKQPSISKVGQHSKAEVEVHYGLLTKGEYPSREQLDEEVHSPVKIYETVLDAQRIALKLHAHDDVADENATGASEAVSSINRLNACSTSKLQTADKLTTPRYTTTTKLSIPDKTLNNQLSNPSRGANNYGFVSTWYEQDRDSNSRGNLYQSQGQYNSAVSWRPNITASCGSTTDNYSSFESSRV